MTRGCGNKTASVPPYANADSYTVPLADTDTIYSKMEYVDLGLSVKWATTNLGTPMTWSQAMHYNKDKERLPTKNEFDELGINVSWWYNSTPRSVRLVKIKICIDDIRVT